MKKISSIITLFLIIAWFSSCSAFATTCDKCGAIVSGNVKFCSECGANVSQNENNEETELKKLSGDEIYDAVSASVVTITAKSSQYTSTGTGFFYTNDIIVTNYHVIEGCTSATITLSDGQSYKAPSVVGYNREKDIALIKISYSDGKPIPIRNENIKTGEKVYTIGNSLGFLEGSLSEGIVSTANRELDGNVYIQTTASVTHGNSGGPLLDEYGRVIGIVSAGFGDGLDLNLAIPVDEINTIDTSDPLNFLEFGTATDPYNVLSNFLKQKGSESFVGFKYKFTDKTGQTAMQISLDYFGFIEILYNVDEDFSFDIRIYPNSSKCDVAATLLDRSLATDNWDESLCIAVRGHTLEEIEKTKVFKLDPSSSNFEFIFWSGYNEKYYSTWRNYYDNYLDDFFIVYDYYITEVAGLSCDSKALGFSFK